MMNKLNDALPKDVKSYRPDIDGLRCLAVLSVILFHINPKYMPSGFLGVDIFFVISGYLITSILYREMSNQRFSFIDFYNRRIKRILPIFFVVIFAGLFVVWNLFLYKDMYSVANSAIASVLFLANIYFSRSPEGYFDSSVEERPFVHIWSLSVEEQFYFIFPLLLLLMFKIKPLKKYKLKFILFLIGGLIASLFIDLIELGMNLNIYYLPHLRMIEMMTGSFLAIYRSERGNRLNVKQSNILAFFSLTLLLTCLFLPNFFVLPHFPGYLSLFPCIATALLIISNEKGRIITKLFSFPIVVWIGKISYSLYLWHWLVLAVFRYFFGVGELSTTNVSIVVLLIFVLSVFSYYAIEQTTRYNKMNFTRSLILFYVIPSVVVFVIWFKMQDVVHSNSELAYPAECHEKLNGNHCTLGDIGKEEKTNILFIGDSFCGHIAPFVDTVGKSEGWKAHLLSAASCSCLFNYDITKDLSSELTKGNCLKMNQIFENKYKDYDIIVFSETFENRIDLYADYISTKERTIQHL
ncbi:MAG: acyltransferase family protein, partial [Bacteroidota bacterium]|nr:acyltransferase family protein [Bacteroidota bacterium]